MNNLVFMSGGRNAPGTGDTRAVSAGLGAAAQRLVLVLGVVVLILAMLAILCELRGIRADLGLDGGRNAPGTMEGGGR